MPTYFDAHAHYSDPRFAELGGAFVAASEAYKVGVRDVMLASEDAENSRANLALSQKLAASGIVFHTAVGIHPENRSRDDFVLIEELTKIERISELPEVKAIGEIGLDYYRDKQHRREQRELFLAQIDIAIGHKLPVVIHDRDAHGDIMDILRAYKGLPTVLHSFSGSVEMMKEAISYGAYISLSGVVTYKNARAAAETAREIPLERLLIETDAPYLAPHPMRGKCNTSAYLQYTAQRIAEIRGVTLDEISFATTKNAKEVFNL